MSAPSDGARADARKARAAATVKTGVYISLDQLSEWRADATERSSRADAHLVFAARILSLIDALEAPCGSCHPCNNWANQTWVNAGERLPHLHEWQEMKAERDALAGVIADAKAEGARAVLEAVKGDSKYGTPQQIIANMLYAARAATARFEVGR